MTGIIEVKVKLYLEMDLDEEAARELVENMDYNFTDPLISHTEVVEDDIAERCERYEDDKETQRRDEKNGLYPEKWNDCN